MSGSRPPSLVIPSRGAHPELLDGLVSLGCPTVIVRTSADFSYSGLASVIDDFGPLCIHRWWNAGLRTVEAAGTRYALVVNDDVSLPPDAPAEMAERMQATDAWLCGADPVAMTGWCWMLDLTSPLRPDERFRWFFGDNDLWLRAEQAGRLTGVNVGAVHHHANEATAASPELADVIRADEALFRQKWG